MRSPARGQRRTYRGLLINVPAKDGIGITEIIFGRENDAIIAAICSQRSWLHPGFDRPGDVRIQFGRPGHLDGSSQAGNGRNQAHRGIGVIRNAAGLSK